MKKNNSIDTFIKVAVLAVLIVWSFLIVRPFIVLIVWSIIVAVSLFPAYKKLVRLLKSKKPKLISAVFTIGLLAIIVVPILNITSSILESTKTVYASFDEESFSIPPPSEEVLNWPVVGKQIYSLWLGASEDLEKFILNNPETVKESVGWVFSSLTGIMSAVFLSIIAIIIAGFLMTSAQKGYAVAVGFANKMIATKGEDIIAMCTNTIRSVVKGILLVAIIQAVLSFVGFSAIGLSAAGILSFLVLFCAIIQIPVSLIVLPIIIYVFTIADTTPAVIFTIYIVLVSLLDNVLKPLLLAKGLQTPMLVIMIGAIGGMMFQGILGLFIGPVVLAIVHRLYSSWIATSA